MTEQEEYALAGARLECFLGAIGALGRQLYIKKEVEGCNVKIIADFHPELGPISNTGWGSTQYAHEMINKLNFPEVEMPDHGSDNHKIQERWMWLFRLIQAGIDEFGETARFTKIGNLFGAVMEKELGTKHLFMDSSLLEAIARALEMES